MRERRRPSWVREAAAPTCPVQGPTGAGNLDTVDFDRDGTQDLVFVAPPGFAMILGHGVRTSGPRIALTGLPNPVDVAPIHADNDGWSDLVTVGATDATTRVWRNDESNGTVAYGDLVMGSSMSIAGIDVELEGDEDVVCMLVGTGQVGTLSNGCL